MGASSWLGGTVYLAWLGGRGGHAAAIRPAWRGGQAADRRRGLVSSAGAAVYGLRRSDPAPAVFGYHEVFHLLVVAGIAAQFLAISLFALPPADGSGRWTVLVRRVA